MIDITDLQFRKGNSREENLPGFSSDFPYLATRSTLNYYEGGFVPWHWHETMELFYVTSGCIEYTTPSGITVVEAGCAGLINSNTLHTTRSLYDESENTQWIHQFSPRFICGGSENRINNKYMLPFTSNRNIEIIKFDAGIPEHQKIIDGVRKAFDIDENELGYELRIRDALSRIWLDIIRTIDLNESTINNRFDAVENNIKLMIAYVHEHFSEKISVENIAASGYTSIRGCYRAFEEYLHTSPTQYLIQCRIREAVRHLTENNYSVADIAVKCGFGDSSCFGRTFRKETGFSPSQYRKNWQTIHLNRNKN